MGLNQTTKGRILDVAEKLFAEQGFSDTSLRQITGEAKVNLASVNYHFGAKKTLIQAVLARYLDEFMPALERAFRPLETQSNVTLIDIFSAMVEPLLSLQRVRTNGTVIFLQLLGRGYIESQGHLRWYVSTHHAETLALFMALIHRALPQASAADVFWRMHFSLGAVVFTVSSLTALSDIAEADFQQNDDIESVIRRLVPYVAAGVGTDDRTVVPMQSEVL